MDVDQIVRSLERDEALGGEVLRVHDEAASAGDHEPIPSDLPAPLRAALADAGIESLYAHQRKALALARSGRNVVLATPTASGKSLCFHLPVLERLLEDGGRALYLFPTKALSRDQLASVDEWIDAAALSVRAHVYDGDTPPHVRRALREEGDLVLTNPNMLHAGILPHHAKWASLFAGLRFVVVDEMHTLGGVFGSHVANVLRRLRRLCTHYGSDPQFLFATATVGNPKALAETLCGESVTVIDRDGAPHGGRTHLFLQPPVTQRALGLRRSVVQHALEALRVLLRAGLHVIVFERSRNGVEILLKYLRDLAKEFGCEPDEIAGYRGGYLPLERRSIEVGLRAGTIRCVVATNALELGIDIGSLDVTVMMGYPGSVSSTFQRAGRAGRRAGRSLSVLVGRSVATDQYLIAHPEHLFDRCPEHVVLDPDNLVIRAHHVKCAAFELPFQAGEEFGGDGDTLELLKYLADEAGYLIERHGRFYFGERSFPAESVSLNTGDVDNFVILDAEKKHPIAEVDRPSAIHMVHPEAIYNLHGAQYHIDSMDYDGRRVYARRVQVDYYTEAETEAEVRVLHLDFERHVRGMALHFGDLGVRKTVPMYKKIRFYTRENIGAGDIHLPPEDLDTEGLAVVVPRTLLHTLGIDGLARGTVLKAFASLLRQVVPLWVRCQPHDVGSTAEALASHFGEPVVYLWDELPGGVGLCERAYHQFEPIAAAMRDIVERCACEQGCPTCIGPSLTGGEREKDGVLKLLRHTAPAASGVLEVVR